MKEKIMNKKINCGHPRKGESLPMQRSEVGNVSPRGIQLQAVNGVAVGEVLTGICVSELGVKPISLDGLATSVATYKAMAKLGVQQMPIGAMRSVGERNLFKRH